jgi:hypothetical protein
MCFKATEKAAASRQAAALCTATRALFASSSTAHCNPRTLRTCYVHCNSCTLRSKGGNNNTYCHDTELNWLDWNAARSDDTGLSRFMRHMVALRRARPELRRDTFVQVRAPARLGAGAVGVENGGGLRTGRVFVGMCGGVGWGGVYMGGLRSIVYLHVCVLRRSN